MNKGRTHSEETKKKLSKALKGKMAGDKHPMYGKRGKDTPRAKKTKMIDKVTGEILMVFESTVEAAIYLDKKVSSGIKACCQGRQKTAYGYKWAYAE